MNRKIVNIGTLMSDEEKFKTVCDIGDKLGKDVDNHIGEFLADFTELKDGLPAILPSATEEEMILLEEALDTLLPSLDRIMDCTVASFFQISHLQGLDVDKYRKMYYGVE